MPVNVKIIPILPRDRKFPLSVLDKLELEMLDFLLDDVGPDIKGEYEKQVDGWSNPPTFPVKAVRGRNIGVEIIPRGKGLKKWIYVNKGTRSRSFSSRGRGPMVFPENYDPKTTAGGQYGGPGRKHGTIRRTHTVKRHKIEPREFEEKIVTAGYIRVITAQLNRVIQTAIKKYG